MLNIFTTNSYNTASKYILGMLSAVDKRNLEHRHIVLVPDRASMSYEQLILDNVGGSFNIEVLTFRRLANRLLAQQNYLTKQASIMVLSGLIADNKDNMCCYSKGTDNIGFVESLYEVICQLKYSRISAKSINIDMLPLELQSQMKDIKLIYSQYEQYLALGYVDSATKLEILIDTLDSQDLSLYHFYVTDFESLSKQELAIIEKLAKKSADVNVTCCYSDKSQDKYLYLNDIYTQLQRIAKQSSLDCNIYNKTDYTNQLTYTIGSNLYRYNNTQSSISRELLSIYVLPTVAQEVTALANDICAHVRKGGKYGDYYVVSSQPERYRHSIERIFADNDIPYFLDTQSILYDHPLCQYVIDYLTASRNNYKQDNVLTVVKNYYFEGGSDVYHFENYCLKYNVSFDYSAFELGKQDKSISFERADLIRAKIDSIINSHPFPAKATVDEYVTMVRTFIDGQELERKTELFAQFCQRNGQSVYAKASEQVCQKLDSVLLQYANILGAKTVKIDEFIKTLSMGLSATTISVLPIVKDSVVITNMGKSRKHDINILALLGANNSQMPIIKKDNKLLSDENMLLLSQHGLEVDYLTKIENNRERFNVFQLLHEPNRLFITCGDSAGDGRNDGVIKPSNFVMQLTKLFGKGNTPYAVSRAVDEDVIYTHKSALNATVINQRRYIDGMRINTSNFALLNQIYGEQSKQFYFDNESTSNIECGAQLFATDKATSVSKIETFYTCPLKHFYNYGLRVYPRTEAKLDNRDFGIILHAVLEKYVQRIDVKESDTVTKQKVNKCFDKVMQEEIYIGIARDSSQRLMLELLREECVYVAKQVKNQMLNSKFTNYKTELTFGMEKGDLKALSLGSEQLKGTIDRVDTYQDMFFCVDYKSGTHGASYTESMLYLGQNIQLPLYCVAVVNNLKLAPVGFYYLKLSNSFGTNGDKPSYKGRSVEDMAVLTLIDNRIQTGRSDMLAAEPKKDGSISSKGSVISKEQFDAQMDYASIMVERAGALIQQGYIKPTIIKDDEPCEYCDYNSICYAPSLGACINRPPVSDVKAQSILDVVSAIDDNASTNQEGGAQ